MKDINYQINDRSSGVFLQVMGELVMRANAASGGMKETLGKTLCLSTAYIRHGICARFFGITQSRKAWIVPSQNNAGEVIVWFSDEGESPNWMRDVTILEGQGNVIPNPRNCHSSFFLSLKKAMDAIEKYIFEGILPESTMPPGHLQSLSGEE